MFGVGKRLARLAAVLFISLVSLCARGDDISAIGAGDRYLIDVLVERGILSHQEALQTRKLMASAPEIILTRQRSLKIYFYSQIRYSSTTQTYSQGGDSQTASNTGASLRRQILAFDADITDGTRAFISINTAALNLFDSLFVQRRVETRFFDYDLAFGYMSPKFNMESPAGAQLKTPDRSILNTFWGGKDPGYDDDDVKRSANQCFAGNHIGVFIDARAPFDEHAFWGVSVTNAKNSYWRELDEKLGLAYWAKFGYAIKTEDVDFSCGINAGYSENIASIRTPYGREKCDCMGVCIYHVLQWGRIFFETEFTASRTSHGKTVSDDQPLYASASGNSLPYGAMAMFGYTVYDGSWGRVEPIFRYAYLDSGGAGVAENNVLYSIKSLNGLYNRIKAYYIGCNWYIDGNTLKFQLGFEHLDFEGSPTGRVAKYCSVDMGIAQFQVEF